MGLASLPGYVVAVLERVSIRPGVVRGLGPRNRPLRSVLLSMGCRVKPGDGGRRVKWAKSPARTTTTRLVMRRRLRSRRSMSLAAKDLSPLLEGQGDHFAVGVALEVDLGADALGDEDILIDRCDFERPSAGALHEELGAGGEDAQRNGGAKRIVAGVLLKRGFGRGPFRSDHARRAGRH